MRSLSMIMVVAAMSACNLDTSGDGEADASETSGTSAGTDSSPTSAPTVTSAETVTEPTTTADTSAESTTPGTTSATTNDDSTGDADLGPFGDITPLDTLNSEAADDDPCMSTDLLEIYFASDRDGAGEDIWRATRASAKGDFDAPEPVDAVNMPGVADTTPELAPDGLSLFFASARAGGLGELDVYVATRRSPADEWDAPVLMEDLSTPLGEGAPTITSDNLTAWICRGQVDAAADLFRGTRENADDPWEVAVFEPINSGGDDCSPWIFATGEELWFSSIRDGGAGDYDIWRAPIVDGAPGDPESVAELNLPGGEDDPWLSPDGLTILFASNRDGTYDLFMATRSFR